MDKIIVKIVKIVVASVYLKLVSPPRCPSHCVRAGEAISVRGVGSWDSAGEAIPLYVGSPHQCCGLECVCGKGKGYNHVRAANAMPSQDEKSM